MACLRRSFHKSHSSGMIFVNRNGLHSCNVSKAYGMRFSRGFSADDLSTEAGRHLD